MIFLILIFQNLCVANMQQRAGILLNAKSIQQLKSGLSELNNLELLKKSCEIEKKNQKIPKNCYLYIKRQKENHDIDAKQFARIQNIYDKECLDFAPKLKEIMETQNLSANCKKAVNQRNKEIRYSRGE